MGFYSTYEVKLLHIVHLLLADIVYSTHENWNLGRYDSERKYLRVLVLWGIENLLYYYKNLKNFVFTVPMRNWNHRTFSRSLLQP